MGVVRVVDVVQAPQSLAGSRGRDVTVKFADIGSKSTADDLLLFTNIGVLGDEIGLTEVASIPWDETQLTMSTLRADLDRAIDDREDQALREQVRISDVVVSGVIIRTTPLRIENTRESEHDPMWTEAVVQVEPVARPALHRIADSLGGHLVGAQRAAVGDLGQRASP